MTTGKHLSDPTSGMRLYDRHVIEQFVKDSNNSPEPDTLTYLMRIGADIREVEVTMAERQEGKSYLTPINATKYMIRVLSSILIFQWFRGKKTIATEPDNTQMSESSETKSVVGGGKL